MPAASTWNTFVWTHFAKPKCDRALFRRVKQKQPQRIVEIGIGAMTRTTRLISLAQRFQQETVYYCGIDLFEARAEGTALRLKDAHYRFAQTGAKIRLVPGDLTSAVGRAANMLTGTDLLIISAEHSQDALQSVFPFFPRMLHENSSIARYSQVNGLLRVRWMKPNSFVTPKQRAA